MKPLMFLVGLLVMLMLGVVGCEREGPVERAGERVDEGVEETRENIEEGREKTEEAVK